MCLDGTRFLPLGTRSQIGATLPFSCVLKLIASKPLFPVTQSILVLSDSISGLLVHINVPLCPFLSFISNTRCCGVNGEAFLNERMNEFVF